jgi:hypothetical protein
MVVGMMKTNSSLYRDKIVIGGMTLTKRGETLLGLIYWIGVLVIAGIAGGIETGGY